MRTVDDCAQIRQLRREHLSNRHIARRLGVGRDTVRKAIQQTEPVPYTLKKPRPAPVIGAFRQLVDDILAADATAPPKQWHTACQIFRRLAAEHNYTGGYDQVRRYLKQLRRDHTETFIPLAHPPGHRAAPIISSPSPRSTSIPMRRGLEPFGRAERQSTDRP